MDYDKYNKIHTEASTIQLKHGGGLNAVIEREKKMREICMKHGSTVMEYRSHRKVYAHGGYLADNSYRHQLHEIIKGGHIHDWIKNPKVNAKVQSKGNNTFRVGGVTGDVYSISDPEQFKQLITVYNDLASQNYVNNYFLDHNDNSIVLMLNPSVGITEKRQISKYVADLRKKGFTIFDLKKSLNNYGLESPMIKVRRDGNQKYFKLHLLDGVKYADGGITEAQNKLSKVFKLPYELAVYVPSTKGVSKEIPPQQFRKRIDEVERYLSSTFGGFSETDVKGGYIANDNELVREKIGKVTAFCGVEDFEQKFKNLLNQIVTWCKDWTQESIGFEFEGDLHYIDSQQVFAKGGQASRKNYIAWKMHEVMSEFKRGKLRSSSGDKVTDRKQAIAIGLSVANRGWERKSKRK